jgi:hypothetical protein
MPDIIGSSAVGSFIFGYWFAKLQKPSSICFAGNIQTTFGQKIFNFPIAQRKSGMQPNSMLNDMRWKSVPGIGDLLHQLRLVQH